MNRHFQSELSSLVIFSIIAALSFAFVVPFAFAEDYYFFRIDTELDVPAYYSSSGATVTWRCNGSGYGIVTDGTASESTNLLDGIIKVASTSAENDSTHAGCDGSEAITATVSFSGWVNELWSDTVSAVGSNVTFTTRASMDYTILVNGVADELGNTLTLNGTTASATYSGTVASQSYSGGKRYIAGSTSGGTVTGGADGYVNRTSSALTVSATASQSVDFGTTDDSSLDESGLSFGHKIRVYESGTGFPGGKITAGTVTAGDSSGVACTIGTSTNAGNWYCAVPLAHTGTTAAFSHDDWQSATVTYTDRTSGSDAQDTNDIAPLRNPPAGTYYPSSTTTPSPTPSPSPTPTPTASPSPTATASPTLTPEPQTVEEKIAAIQAKIIELQTRIAELLGQAPSTLAPVSRFQRDLYLGAMGDDVRALQDYLTSTGHFNYEGGSTGYFGPITKAAVAAWQEDNGVSPTIGYFGPISRAKYSELTQ